MITKTREEEIQEQALNYAEKIDYDLWLNTEHPKSYVKMLVMAAAEDNAKWVDEHPKNPWVTDRMPEINDNGWSDPVLLHVDGQFLKVSRYCRRKDGTTYWNGVEDWNGEEVDAWMPIPKLEGGEK